MTDAAEPDVSGGSRSVGESLRDDAPNFDLRNDES